jgi:hypothetical protein
VVEVVCLAVSHGFKDVCWTFGYQREDFAHIERLLLLILYQFIQLYSVSSLLTHLLCPMFEYFRPKRNSTEDAPITQQAKSTVKYNNYDDMPMTREENLKP